MAITRPKVLRWSAVVDAELARAKTPLPRELILSVIDIESRGNTGEVNPKSGASGLMQVMPGTLKGYNDNHPAEQITLAEMRGTLPLDAVKQIRVGLWVLATYWRSAWKYLSARLSDVPIDELAIVADLFYVAGPGATKKLLDKLPSPTWEAIQSHYPNWNALPHPRNVFGLLGAVEWPTEKISSWIGQKGILNIKPKDGFVVSLFGIMISWYLLQKGKTL